MDPDTQALLESLKEARQTDPNAGLGLGAKSLVQRLTYALQTESGINADQLMMILGSLTGYACQQAVRQIAAAQQRPAQLIFTITTGGDGRRYMSGDHLNFFLFQGPRSVWRGISSMAKALGAADHELPNVTEIAQYVAWTVAMGQFGYVRFPPGHGATPSPEEALRHFWPQWAPDLRLFAPSPDKQPELMTIAVRTAMNQAKEVLHPCDALAIVMESAIAMSRVDLPQEYWGYSEDSQSQPRAFSE